MLKLITVAVGLLIVILRGVGVLSPGKLRGFAEKLVTSEALTRGVGILLLVISVLIYFAARNNSASAAVVMQFLGVVWLVGGVLLISAPSIYASMVKWFLKLSDSTIRLLCTVGVLFGGFLIFLGIAYY